jgi:thiol-disulfide isomerase/thioredoxin
MKLLPLIASMLILFSAVAFLRADNAAPEPAPEKKVYSFPKEGDPLRAIKMDEIQELVQHHDSEILVVNFWATWCAPCVAELPYFAAADDTFRDKGVRIVGLSLDNFTYEAEWQQISAATMKERGVRYANFAVDADPEQFVRWFAEEWSGAIPATFYFDSKGNKIGQHLRDVTREELEADITRFLEAAAAAKADPAE